MPEITYMVTEQRVARMSEQEIRECATQDPDAYIGFPARQALIHACRYWVAERAERSSWVEVAKCCTTHSAITLGTCPVDDDSCEIVSLFLRGADV